MKKKELKERLERLEGEVELLRGDITRLLYQQTKATEDNSGDFRYVFPPEKSAIRWETCAPYPPEIAKEMECVRAFCKTHPQKVRELAREILERSDL